MDETSEREGKTERRAGKVKAQWKGGGGKGRRTIYTESQVRR